MSRLISTTLASIALLASLGAPGMVLASEFVLDAPELGSTVAVLGDAEITLAPSATGAASGETMAADDMANMSGGTDTTVNTNAALSHQELTATSTGNTIQATDLNMVSGDVNFDAGSLGNFNGIGNFVINTGANNVLQGSINVTIATTTPVP